MTSSNRKLQATLSNADAAMLHRLAELRGENFAQVASYCLNDYLQNNYQRLHDFYSSAPRIED